MIDAEGYINNCVNMTRCFGDRRAKFYERNDYYSRSFAIVATPEVKVLRVQTNHEFLLLACDGLFEAGCFSSGGLCQRAQELLATDTPSQDVAEILCNEAVAKGSGDNCSVMLIDFTNQ